MIEQYMVKARPSVIVMVTQDKYELPLLITSTVDEMSMLTGVKRNTIYTSIKRGRGRFYKVYIDEEDE